MSQQQWGWGGLAKRTHRLDAPEYAKLKAERPWKDNMWLVFWDPVHDAYGMLHTSTSPNGAPRKTRAVLSVNGRIATLDEVPPPGVLSSASVNVEEAYGEGYDGKTEHRVWVESPDIRLSLTLTPRWRPLDYTVLDTLPALGNAPPLNHWQQGMNATGWVEAYGVRTEFQGHGFRDRTWGWRHESRMFHEIYGMNLCFPDFDITTMKVLLEDGSVRVGGYFQNQDGAHQVRATEILYKDVATVAACDAAIDDIGVIHFEAGPTRAGWWLTLNGERSKGPAMSEWDHMLSFDAGTHGKGFGIFPHVAIRRLT